MDDWFEKHKVLIAEFKPLIGFFEREQLLPEMVSRLLFIKECMLQLIEVCNDPNTAIRLDASLREVLNDRHFNVTSSEALVGEEYLTLTKTLLQKSFVIPINELTDKSRTDKALNNIEELAKYFNELNLFYNSIFFVREQIFKCHYRTFWNIVDKKSGNTIVSPPYHFEIILIPFEGMLEELINVARRSSDSIELWANQMRTSRQKHTELYVNLYQIKSSKTQARVSEFTLYAQIFAVVLVFVLIYFSPMANTYVENRQLNKTIESVLTENTIYKNELLTMKNKNIDLVKKLDSLHQENLKKKDQ